jgi:hypothetical protein
MKDEDDFILSLIRNPAFPQKVNDIAVECGNSLYQPSSTATSPEKMCLSENFKKCGATQHSRCATSGFLEEFFSSRPRHQPEAPNRKAPLRPRWRSSG